MGILIFECFDDSGSQIIGPDISMSILRSTCRERYYQSLIIARIVFVDEREVSSIDDLMTLPAKAKLGEMKPPDRGGK